MRGIIGPCLLRSAWRPKITNGPKLGCNIFWKWSWIWKKTGRSNGKIFSTHEHNESAWRIHWLLTAQCFLVSLHQCQHHFSPLLAERSVPQRQCSRLRRNEPLTSSKVTTKKKHDPKSGKGNNCGPASVCHAQCLFQPATLSRLRGFGRRYGRRCSLQCLEEHSSSEVSVGSFPNTAAHCQHRCLKKRPKDRGQIRTCNHEGLTYTLYTFIPVNMSKSNVYMLYSVLISVFDMYSTVFDNCHWIITVILITQLIICNFSFRFLSSGL